MNSTSSISHESISRRAYQIWEEAGHPNDDGTAHWLQAERELRSRPEKPSGANHEHGRSVMPPIAPKHIPERAPHSTDYVHPGVTTDSLHHFRNRKVSP